MTKEIQPHFKVVAIDHTEYWDDYILQKTGRIWSTFLFDANQHTHLCSLTPSYYLLFIEHLTEDELDDETYDVLRQSPDGDNYYDVNYIDRKPANHFEDLGERPIPEGETYDEVLEEVLEYVKCNQQAPKVTWSK